MPVELRGSGWRVRARWSGLPPFETTVREESLARDLDAMLQTLRRLGRRDILTAIARRELSVSAVWFAVRVEQWNAAGVRTFMPHVTPAHTVQWLRSTCGATASSSPTFETLLGEFISEAKEGIYMSKRRTTFAPDTLDRYLDSFNALFAWDERLKGLPPSALSASDLAEFRASRMAGGVSNGTLNRDQDAIQSFYTWLNERRPQFMPEKRPKSRSCANQSRKTAR